MSDTVQTEASHAAEIELLREELAQKNAEVANLGHRLAELETELGELMNGKTWPPQSIVIDREEDTGDMTVAKQLAEMAMRQDAIEARESERAGALQELSAQVRVLITLTEKLTAINPKDFRDLADFVRALPCNHCGDDTKLSLVPSSRR